MQLLPSTQLVLLLTLSVLLTSATTCGKKKDAVPTAAPPTTTARLASLEYFTVKEITSKAESYILHKAGQGNAKEPCRISKKDLTSNPQRILCWLEAGELDLWFYGVEFSVEVPSGVCEYIDYRPFWFWTFQPGSTTTTYKTYANTGCTTCDGGTCPVSESKPGFRFDYTAAAEGGPNCDIGIVTQENTTYTAGATSTQCLTNPTTVTTTTKGGGKWQNCITGPGKVFKSDKDGYPRSVIYYANEGLLDTWKHTSLASQDFHTSRFLANYTKFCAETGVDSYTYDTTNFEEFAALANNGFKSNFGGVGIGAITDPRKYGAAPAYIWTCLNKAEEVKGRIVIQIREWNKTFTVDDDIDTTVPAKMDAGGTEDPFGVNNDIKDWDDIVAQNPDCSNSVNSTGFHFPFRVDSTTNLYFDPIL